MLEKELQRAVVDLARYSGWRVHHTRTVNMAGGGWTSPGLDKGFPDLVLVGHRRIIFAELKTDRGQTTYEQKGWLDAIARAGAECYIWRPRDWAHIVEVLQPVRSHVKPQEN